MAKKYPSDGFLSLGIIHHDGVIEQENVEWKLCCVVENVGRLRYKYLCQNSRRSESVGMDVAICFKVRQQISAHIRSSGILN